MTRERPQNQLAPHLWQNTVTTGRRGLPRAIWFVRKLLDEEWWSLRGCRIPGFRPRGIRIIRRTILQLERQGEFGDLAPHAFELVHARLQLAARNGDVK